MAFEPTTYARIELFMLKDGKPKFNLTIPNQTLDGARPTIDLYAGDGYDVRYLCYYRDGTIGDKGLAPSTKANLSERAGTQVIILEDRRPGGDAHGAIGVYEDHRPRLDATGVATSQARIRLADGTIIWGADCAWAWLETFVALVASLPLTEHEAAIAQALGLPTVTVITHASGAEETARQAALFAAVHLPGYRGYLNVTTLDGTLYYAEFAAQTANRLGLPPDADATAQAESLAAANSHLLFDHAEYLDDDMWRFIGTVQARVILLTDDGLTVSIAANRTGTPITVIDLSAAAVTKPADLAAQED